MAGFLVVRLGLYFKHSASNANSALVLGAIQPNDEENLLLKDSDNDGIADVDEAYYRTNPLNPDSDGDGYLDGEEIASNFYPTIKEGDKERGQEQRNITKTFTDRLFGGIYAGDLNPRNGTGPKYNENVNYLALATIDEALNKIKQKPADDVILTTTNSVAYQEEYLQKITEVMDGSFLDAFMGQPQIINRVLNLMLAGQYEEAVKILADYHITFTGAYTKLLTIPASENWVNFHKHLLSFFRKIALDYNYATQLEDDPMLALTALSDLGQTLANVDISILQELRTLLKNNNLRVPNSTLFEVLGLLNNN